VNHETPLIIASRYGYMDIVKLLVKNGANMNHKGKGGDTAIMHACFNNHLDIAHYFLQQNAHVNISISSDNYQSNQFFLMFQKAYLHAHKTLCQALLAMNHQVYHHYLHSISCSDYCSNVITDQLVQHYGMLVSEDKIHHQDALFLHNYFLCEDRWHRRKYYIHFLIECGYRYHQGGYRSHESSDTQLRKIFSNEDVVRTICAFL